MKETLCEEGGLEEIAIQHEGHLGTLPFIWRCSVLGALVSTVNLTA